MTLNLKFQPHESADYKDVEATAIKRFEPITSDVVLLVRNRADNDNVEMPWSSSIEDRLRRAIRDIRGGRILNWFELINDRENRPDPELWEDWTWEVLTWLSKVSNYETELTAYRLLHRLQGRYIPCLFGVVRLNITSESTLLRPVTDTVHGLVLEYIPGVCMDKLRPGIDVSEQEAERISSEVMEGLRAIEAENCVIHDDIHTRNVVCGRGACPPSSSTLEWHTSGSRELVMNGGMGSSTEV
ncbi:uncharacterized protein ARMOST_15872 [Armillaria ostoyae]|uniref:Protein kinase domain-containing protein n=1 Tax=Armillaria ostoyae TaxID=47428 RepID=A0A284RUR4_ARMOS|nr:uncharacterized protein ARMOST_15872 [Armillaria ostoyae]